MQPILRTIFDISSFKPSSVAVTGGGGEGGGGGGGGAVQSCLYRTRLQPRIQVFSCPAQVSYKNKTKKLLISVLLYVKIFFHSIINKVG